MFSQVSESVSVEKNFCDKDHVTNVEGFGGGSLWVCVCVLFLNKSLAIASFQDNCFYF